MDDKDFEELLNKTFKDHADNYLNINDETPHIFSEKFEHSINKAVEKKFRKPIPFKKIIKPLCGFAAAAVVLVTVPSVLTVFYKGEPLYFNDDLCQSSVTTETEDDGMVFTWSDYKPIDDSNATDIPSIHSSFTVEEDGYYTVELSTFNNGYEKGTITFYRLVDEKNSLYVKDATFCVPEHFIGIPTIYTTLRFQAGIYAAVTSSDDSNDQPNYAYSIR